MEARHFYYVPTWVKIIAFVLIIFIVSTSAYVVLQYIAVEGRESWILVSMSGVQIGGSGLIVLLLFFFSERDTALSRLQKEIDYFLGYFLPRHFQQMDTAPIPWRSFSRRTRFSRAPSKVTVEVEHNEGTIGAFYRLTAHGQTLRVYAQLNVHEMTLVYYIPAGTKEEFDTLRNRAESAFDAAVKARGYDMFAQHNCEEFDDQWYLDFFLIRNLGDDFLVNNNAKLFWAHDIAMMTRGLILHCNRNKIRLS